MRYVNTVNQRRGSERGFVQVAILMMTALSLTMGIGMLTVQQAALRDTFGIHKAGQAKFLANSAQQEAQYLITKVNPSFSGTSGEQLITIDGKNYGSYEYSVSKSGNTYTVASSGYYPSKSASGSAVSTASASFTYASISITPTTNGIVILNSSQAGSLAVSGNGTLNVGGKVWVDSSASNGTTASGNATINATEFDMVGSYSVSGNAHMNGTKKTITAFTDPFASIAEPDASAMTVQATNTVAVSGSTSKVFNPGVYSGGISIAGNASATFNPGVYYIKATAAGAGTGLKISGNGVVTASKVMFFIEAADTGQGLSISGNGSLSWTPVTSGTYNGFAYFQKRSSTLQAKITGNANTLIGGTLYMAAANMLASGNGSNLGSLLVADTLSISGNASMNNYGAVP